MLQDFCGGVTGLIGFCALPGDGNILFGEKRRNITDDSAGVVT
jgi:hypothetical protein